MAQKNFQVDLNLNLSQLLQALFENVTALPAENKAGRIVYLTTDKHAYKNNGEKWNKILEDTDAAVTLQKDASGLVYTLSQGGTEIGKINIPKDMVVQSGSVVKGTFAQDGGFTESASGKDTALKLVIANSTDVVYINVKDLASIYTGGTTADITVTVSDTGVITATLSQAVKDQLDGLKNNAWKLDIANPECETVVIALQPGQGIFEAMEKAGIGYLKSRNIYVDLSAAGEWSGENIFAGYEKAPIGVRYHIFFGNVKNAIKLYWASTIESNKLSGSLALTAEYPTAKCEFMRVTDSWTYADWEALIDEVSHVIDTGTASESDNGTLMNYMDNNKVSYTKTSKGALVNITTLLAALASSK